jgi:hypothetical protein
MINICYLILNIVLNSSVEYLYKGGVLLVKLR